ncbi:MAG: hypothetical protein B7Z55_14375 [Planctomycetales bacterium 12-60-4]|nr:MAG: hypothetical protein B7Z55_14375 [Planctomycetales bacterium 12-60-4]
MNVREHENHSILPTLRGGQTADGRWCFIEGLRDLWAIMRNSSTSVLTAAFDLELGARLPAETQFSFFRQLTILAVPRRVVEI